MSTTVASSAAISFFQVNSAQAAELVSIVLGALDLKGKEHVLDAYCGVNRPKRRPTIRSTGNRKAQTESTKVSAASFREARCTRSGA